MKVTIKQIAEIAGVHRSTVDKVLHNREGVSDEVRSSVQAIIEELDYQPNVIGKALASQKNPLTFAVLLLNVDAMDQIKEGIEVALQELSNFGLKIEYFISNATDDLEQWNIIEMVRKRGVDAVIINPVATDRIKKAINMMVEADISVLTVNSDIPESKRMVFIGQDSYKAGRVAGSLMGEVLNGQGKVALTTGRLNSTLERVKGFEDALVEKYSDIEIVEAIEINESKELALRKTLTVINDYDIDGLFISTGNVNEVMKAVKLKNLDSDLKVICFDLYEDIKGLLKSEAVNFTIGQDLQDQGYRALKTMFDYLFLKKEVQVTHIKTAIDIRVRDNI